MADTYLTARIKASIVFEDGTVFNDVVSVAATFALNSIPTASVIVPVGKTFMDGGEKKATIHTARKSIKARSKAKVYVRVSDLYGERIGIEEGYYLVFEGYVAGVGYQRSANHANYVINLIHWLDDLNNSSAINGNWFPGAPHDWAQQAIFDTISVVTSYSNVPTVLSSFVTPIGISTDLWEQTFKPMFAAIGGFSSALAQRRFPPAQANAAQRNDGAEEALKRMPGNSPNYVPLALDVGQGTVADPNLSKSIAKFLTSTLGESFVQNTFWSKIVNEYAAQFFFAISPSVEWATPIPFCAGLKAVDGDARVKVITAKEYNYANFNANMSQLLSSVHIFYPVASATALPTGPADPRLSYYRPWASFPPAAKAKNGLKLFKNPPGWLSHLDPATINTPNAVNGRRDMFARPGSPPAGSPPVKGAATADAHNTYRPFAEKLAEHWYYTEVLQQRYGEFSGPLRFDIAPGSILKIMTPPRDAALESGITPHVVSSVISVSYVINSEKATAGTSFTIAHQKTKEENEDPSLLYATDKPPLYKEPWFGGPLTINNQNF